MIRFISQIKNDNPMLSEELIMELHTVPEITQALEIAKKVDIPKRNISAMLSFGNLSLFKEH